MKCFQCQGQRIVTGVIRDKMYQKECIFAPDGLKFTAMTVSYGTKLESFACLDCGNVWLKTSPQALEEFVRKHCDQKIGG